MFRSIYFFYYQIINLVVKRNFEKWNNREIVQTSFFKENMKNKNIYLKNKFKKVLLFNNWC